jgi:rhamnogalacturonan endolyase
MSPIIRKAFLFLCGFFAAFILQAQPAYSSSIQKEKLGRGLVLLRDGDSLAVSWRLLEGEKKVQFNVYQDGKRLNGQNITEETFFKTIAPDEASVITLSMIKNEREFIYETPYTPHLKNYIPIPLSKPDDGITPDGQHYTYSANDASVGDVDGDGEYEIILKWDPSNSHDNSHEGYTGNVYLDCYKIPCISKEQEEGSTPFLWRINLGPNIRAGAHYTQFLVYDFDGNGRAELVTKTADGTIDGAGVPIGDADADWVTNGRILNGPEYLTVFDGLTGRALQTVSYQPPRGDVASWGDNYGNRCDRFLAAVAYLDGKHPSAVMCRGYYTKTYLAAYDWDGKDLSLRWIFDSQEYPGYSGQGNHNLRVGDVDGDGCDEITYGAMAVDDNGTGLYTTRMGHGDAMHQYAFYPDSTQLQIWDVHENKRDGSEFRDAKTGRVIFQIPSNTDVGRGMAADIDPTIYGLEMWSSSQRGLFDVEGTHYYTDISFPQNSAVWWDGDLLRELLDSHAVLKWNWNAQKVENLMDFRAEKCIFNNGTKQNPCLSADILGDWREEVIVRDNESTELRIYSTTIPTYFGFPCLMLDIPYRLSVATENVAYNQPPEPGFYLGSDLYKKKK